MDKKSLKERHLISTGYHLPYNPDLKLRARKLRKKQTPSEKKLWKDYLRNFPYAVLRQKPLDHYIADFYCPKLKLVIEVDGWSHYTKEGQSYDKQRTEILETYGLNVLRFRNNEVLNKIDEVINKIESYKKEYQQNPHSPFIKGGVIQELNSTNKEGGLPPEGL
jgi:very-short-patch-repair endonuclease